MDLVVREIAESIWVLSDLLNRLAGHVERGSEGTFRIVPTGRAVETMHGMPHGPYASLDAALAAIEIQTRGTCRLTESHGPADALEDLRPAEPGHAEVIELRTMV